MAEREHRIFGDWRDLGGAIEASDPTWRDRPDTEKDSLWKFAEGVIREYQPMRAQCCKAGGCCGAVLPHWRIYRCADCNTTYCEHCIRRHFETTGPLTRHSLEHQG